MCVGDAQDAQDDAVRALASRRIFFFRDGYGLGVRFILWSATSLRGEVGFVVCGSVPGVGGFTIVVFPFLCLFPCAWVGPVDLRLCDLIVHSFRPVGGARHT